MAGNGETLFTISDILDIAITMEKNGKEFYRNTIMRVRNQSVIELLNHLGQQEEEHLKSFQRLKEEYLRKAYLVDPPRKSEEFIFREAMTDHLLSWDEHSPLDEKIPFEELLKFAIEFEQDSIRFYTVLSEFLQTPDKYGIIKRIIAEEEEHVKLLSFYTKTSLS